MMLWLAELPLPRAEQAASGHWAQLSHNWISTGTGPNFANIPEASEKHYLTSKSQPCPTHLISQHLTKSACDSEALKANTVKYVRPTWWEWPPRVEYFYRRLTDLCVCKTCEMEKHTNKQQRRRWRHWDKRGTGRAQWCALADLVN